MHLELRDLKFPNCPNTTKPEKYIKFRATSVCYTIHSHLVILKQPFKSPPSIYNHNLKNKISNRFNWLKTRHFHSTRFTWSLSQNHNHATNTAMFPNHELSSWSYVQLTSSYSLLSRQKGFTCFLLTQDPLEKFQTLLFPTTESAFLLHGRC